MKRKAKRVPKKHKKQLEMLLDMNQAFSGQDQFAFEMAGDEEDAGFVFEADFEAE